MAKPQLDNIDTNAALANIHDCVKRLRHALNKSASLQAVISTASSGPHTPENPHPLQELEECGQKMLASVIAASIAHDSIIRDVSASRKRVSDDQEALLKVRLRLDNLSHEKRALQQQIDVCKSVKSKLLDKLNISLPTVNTESDELASSAHQATTTALSDELAKRKRMRQLVESVVKETSAKRRKLSESKSELRELPRAIRSLAPSIKPIRKLFAPNDSPIGRQEDLAKIHHLPGPLYVLCRTASAYRETFGGLDISTVGEPVTDVSRFEAEKATDQYFLHPMQARIDIKDDANGPKLRISFRYHVNLQIVTVTSVMVVNGQETPSYPTKELQMLYPLDFGELSPNPKNECMNQSSFEFDITKTKGGRPYIWANILCGIPCFPRISPSQGVQGGLYLDWPNVAAQYPDHLRFKDVVETLRERLRTIVPLKSQIEALLSKRLPVSAQALHMSSEPLTKVDEFVKLSPKVGDEELSRPGTDGKYTEVWGLMVSRGELRIMCMIGLEPDYPVGPPVFRLNCTSTIPNVSEKDILELERCVNEYSGEDRLGERREMLLGAQIRTLLIYVDNLVAACESIDEGTVESGSGEIKGRTRSKREAILGKG